jgi:hypothetical protein
MSPEPGVLGASDREKRAAALARRARCWSFPRASPFRAIGALEILGVVGLARMALLAQDLEHRAAATGSRKCSRPRLRNISASDVELLAQAFATWARTTPADMTDILHPGAMRMVLSIARAAARVGCLRSTVFVPRGWSEFQRDPHRLRRAPLTRV